MCPELLPWRKSGEAARDFGSGASYTGYWLAKGRRVTLLNVTTFLRVNGAYNF